MLAKWQVFMYKKIVTAIALLPIFLVSSENLTFNSFDLSNIISNLLISPVEAVQLRDGKTYFVQLPIFLDAEATVNSINARSVTYYFAIALPKNMGEPLQKLEFFQTEGFESVDFIHNDTVAYLQKPSGDRPNSQFLGYGRLNFYSSRY